MAKKSSVNVSEAIRDYLKANSDVGPTAAAEAVSKQVGKKVPASYVSNIKAAMSSKSSKTSGQTRRGRKRRASRNGAALHGKLDLSTIESMKAIVAKVGAETAKGLIDVLA